MTSGHAEHPEAGAELFAAAERLEEAQPGLGHALFASVREAISAIERYPHAWPPLTGWDREPVVRAKSTKRFPFRVVYVVHEGAPVILAYAHERQRPGYWRRRYDGLLDR
ncbi:hypothetical protein ACH0AH_09120 [Microbacterium paludicola]|uniref:hypothetical protein n=1 Tax=Microbacterium paludicola TaxID=300019 RepID=UPI0038798061